MATVTNWITHLTTDSAGDEIGIQIAGAVYPGVGSESILVLVAFVIWIGWHVITNMSESNDLEKLARKRHSANDHKSNITDW